MSDNKGRIINPTSISNICKQCKGKHFEPKDPMASQKNAYAEYGIIPSDCVPSTHDLGRVTVNCPYSYINRNK